MANYLEHVQYVCSNLDTMVNFYCYVFDWPLRGRGKEVTTDRTYDWVHIGTDDSYVAFRSPYDGVPYSPDMGYRHNHIGIVVDDFERVLTRLEQLGAPVSIKGQHPFRSRAYFKDPDGYEVEVVHYHSNDPGERNDYAIDAIRSQR
jgi:catechol 2,3-dioxygenase-like lactoylglutathione lyase family enzyme